MKKISILLIFLLSFFMIGCGNKDAQIKEDYLTYAHEKGDTNITIDNVKILKRYGIYHDAHVLLIDRSAYEVTTTITVGGIEFGFNNTNTALVWKEGQFYELQEAYEKNILSLKDLQTLKKSSFPETKLTLVPFSRDGGKTYIEKDDYLEKFDIYSEDNQGYIFFYSYTYEELRKSIEKYEKYFNFEYSFNNLENAENVEKIFERYDETFFNEHVLLFYYRPEANISKNYAYEITKERNTLTLVVNRFEGMAAAISSWVELITIKKEDIKDVKEMKVNLRTIAALQDRFSINLNNEHIRDIYINGLTMENFKNIDNLKNISVFTSSLIVDLVFKERLTKEKLEEVIIKLEANKGVSHLGYKGTDFIRVIMKGKYFDKIFYETLLVTELLDENDVSKYQASLKFMTFNPFGFVTFYLEKPGRENALELEKRIKKMNYRFLVDEDAWW